MSVFREQVTRERLIELFSYNATGGEFVRRIHRSHNAVAGQVAGTDSGKDGYIRINIDACIYLSHRLVWLYVHGRWPTSTIDHVNGKRSDNRLSNLREATLSQNAGNKVRQRNNKAGRKGVTFDARRHKWRATIVLNRKQTWLGYFASVDAASAAYARAASEIFGPFARTE